MKLLTHIDVAVLGWHQGVVDFLERRPVELGRLCWLVKTLSLLVFCFMVAPKLTYAWVLLLWVFVSCGLCWLYCRSDAAFARLGGVVMNSRARVMGIVALVVICGFSLDKPGLAWVPLIVSQVSLLAFDYFAACRPPRPRPPRRAASLAGGAA